MDSGWRGMCKISHNGETMKKTISLVLVSLGLLECAAFSHASPYFRPIDISHPQVSAGAIFSASGIKQSVGVTDLALITHSTADGSIIPASLKKYLAPEDWVPLQIGAGGSFTGSAIVNVGASINIAPQIASLAISALGKSGSASAKALQTALESPQSGLSFAFGPSWYFYPVESGTALPLRSWQGKLGLFIGAAWRF